MSLPARRSIRRLFPEYAKRYGIRQAHKDFRVVPDFCLTLSPSLDLDRVGERSLQRARSRRHKEVRGLPLSIDHMDFAVRYLSYECLRCPTPVVDEYEIVIG